MPSSKQRTHHASKTNFIKQNQMLKQKQNDDSCWNQTKQIQDDFIQAILCIETCEINFTSKASLRKRLETSRRSRKPATQTNRELRLLFAQAQEDDFDVQYFRSICFGTKTFDLAADHSHPLDSTAHGTGSTDQATAQTCSALLH